MLKLRANFFPVTTSHQNWSLHNYRVDFEPDEERTFVKKTLIRAHQERLGAYIFDGSNLYTSTPLEPNVILDIQVIFAWI